MSQRLLFISALHELNPWVAVDDWVIAVVLPVLVELVTVLEFEDELTELVASAELLDSTAAASADGMFSAGPQAQSPRATTATRCLM